MPLPPVVLTPSMTNCVLVMISSQASHVSPLPAPPQRRGILFWGKRPSASLLRMRRRRVSCSIGGSLLLLRDGGAKPRSLGLQDAQPGGAAVWQVITRDLPPLA